MIAERYCHQANQGPFLSFWTKEQLDSIHFAACRILRTTGMIVEHEGAASRLHSAGAHVVKNAGIWRVRFPEWLINDSLASAPKSLVLGAREKANDFYLQHGRVGFSTFGEQVKIIDLKTKEYRSSVRSDVRDVYKGVDALPGLVVGSRTLCPNDLPMPLQQAHNFYDALTCSSKHIWMGLTNQETIDLAKKMVIRVAGEERARHTAINTVTSCPTSPLTLVAMCCQNIIGAAETEVMNVEIMDMCLAGGTSPVNPASAVLMTVCEHLAGLSLSQVARKGMPTILGTCSTNLDLKAGLSPMASPENALIASGVAQMARYYNLPLRAGVGVTESNIGDAQAGYEFSFNCLPLALSGANILWGAGGVDSGLGFDFAKLLMDHEASSNIRYFLRGLPVNDEELPLDLIEEVGPGGSYLNHKHTFKRTRIQAPFSLFERQPFATWEKRGSRTMTERAYDKAADILANHQVPPIDPQAQADIDEMLKEFVERYGPKA